MSSIRPVSDLTAHIGFWLRMVSNHVSHAFAVKLADREVTRALPEKTLRARFDLDYHLKHVDTIFDRVFGKGGAKKKRSR